MGTHRPLIHEFVKVYQCQCLVVDFVLNCLGVAAERVAEETKSCVAELDEVIYLQGLRVRDPLSVDVGSVRAPQISNDQRGNVVDNLGVEIGHRMVRERQRNSGAASNEEGRRMDRNVPDVVVTVPAADEKPHGLFRGFRGDGAGILSC